MEGSVAHTYLSDILHVVSQALLAPDIILLLLFICYALFCIGSIVAEYFSERRYFKIVMPKFLAALMSADEGTIPAVIKESGLLRRQKIALLTVYDYRTLPGDALVALIRRLVNEEESRYDRITGRNNMAARVSPMLGLMGTLIPLGPGIQALGKADTAALSSSLLVAFDTTVAGLVVAAVCLVVGKIRQNWYSNYMNALDSGMATMLQKIEDMRAEGKITIEEPSDYAFLFEQSAGRPPERSARKKDEKREDGNRPRRETDGTDSPKADHKPAPTSQPISRAEADQAAQKVEELQGRSPRSAASPVTNASSESLGIPMAQKATAGPADTADFGIAQTPSAFDASAPIEPLFPPQPLEPLASTPTPSASTSWPQLDFPTYPTGSSDTEVGSTRATSGWYQPNVRQGADPIRTRTSGDRMLWGARQSDGQSASSDSSSESR